MRPVRILRNIFLTALTLTLALFPFVQLQQHLLRHRAERLHNEFVALQLHPGTFADIQRLQHEWGRFAHYDGECTPHHCIYTISLSDFSGFLHRDPDPWYFRNWMYRPYLFLGGRPANINASVSLRDDRMWKVRDGLGIAAITWRDIDDYFMLAADSTFGSRLFDPHGSYSASAMTRGYWVGRPGGCTFCVMGWINMSPEAAPSDIRRLTTINLDCITARQPCRTLHEIIPSAWAEYSDSDGDNPRDDRYDCSASLELFAREAANIITVSVNTTTGFVAKLSPEQSAEVTVDDRLKNAIRYTPGRHIRIAVRPYYFIPIAQSHAALERGSRYILLFRDSHNYLNACSIVPLTQGTMSAVQRGIAADPSTGEPYSGRD